jgi:hypothetical protein
MSLLDRIRTRLARYGMNQGARGIQVARLGVSCTAAEAAQLKVALVFKLTHVGINASGPLAVNFSNSALRDDAVVAGEFDMCAAQYGPKHRRCTALAPLGGASWEGTEITVRGLWDFGQNDNPQRRVALTIPDDVPLVASAEYFLEADRGVAFIPGDVPQEITLNSPLPAGITIAGVSRQNFEEAVPFPSAQFIQLSLCQLPATEIQRPFWSPLLGGTGSASLAADRRERVRQVVQDALSFLESECGVAKRVRPLILLEPETVANEKLGANLVDPGNLMMDQARAEDALAVVMHLSRFWWGIGCRVRGAQGPMLLASIGLAMALRWSAKYGREMSVPEILARWRDSAKGPSARCVVDAQGRVGESLARALNNEAVRSAFQSRTSASWGMAIDADVLLKEVVGWASG